MIAYFRGGYSIGTHGQFQGFILFPLVLIDGIRLTLTTFQLATDLSAEKVCHISVYSRRVEAILERLRRAA